MAKSDSQQGDNMTFEELKAKVEQLKTKRDQALGAIKNIEDGWEQKYGTRDCNVVQDKLRAMQSECDQLDADMKAKLAEAEKLLEGAA